MKLVVTIDVEEEGLFRGRYESGAAPVSNVGKLELLDRLFCDLGVRPTLLVTYQVARHSFNRPLLMNLRERWKGEIGAHLHAWNTPPLARSSPAEPPRSEQMSSDLLASKLDTLMEALRTMGVDPVSFRMGRFDMGPRMFSVLEQTAIRTDSSISPMRGYPGGPAHLCAPVDPFFPDPANPCAPGASGILEVPITILPVLPGLGSLLNRLWEVRTVPREWISWFAMKLASLPIQPVWTGLGRLQAAVRLHRSRGGGVVTIFFHSSELMPGGSPQHPSERHVERFLKKLTRFLTWLRQDIHVESLTLGELYARMSPDTDVARNNDGGSKGSPTMDPLVVSTGLMVNCGENKFTYSR